MIDVLVQVNVAGEESKFGIRPEEPPVREGSKPMGNIRVKA
jgi:uncharacterized pyridoxal phosphate-containing UPF0001 family protein